jgi:hypothetical protein
MLGLSLGIAYAAIWSGIIYVITPNVYGKAFAVLVAVYNIGFTVVPTLIGFLRR